ncbi:MAG TPA: SCO family protein [Ktedonobacterales bacterium]|nr:SCO family protein [Ktedonobacterales bacterium]
MATPTTQQPQSNAPRQPVRNNALLLRTISRVIVGALVVIVAAVFGLRAILSNGQSTAPKLQGTSLGGVAAPSFTLTDQNGTRVSLADLRGHPVVLAFFYTHCPDECPLTASKFQRVLANSGSQLSSVRWVAISTDPVGDTPQAATDFVAQHGLTGKLHYLLGTEADLSPIWSEYSVAVENGSSTHSASNAGAVQHTTGVWLIDAQGREQVYLNTEFDPQVLAADLKILAGQ